jgi:hypothetical protein
MNNHPTPNTKDIQPKKHPKNLCNAEHIPAMQHKLLCAEARASSRHLFLKLQF